MEGSQLSEPFLKDGGEISEVNTKESERDDLMRQIQTID
jgi:hypothetical protein